MATKRVNYEYCTDRNCPTCQGTGAFIDPDGVPDACLVEIPEEETPLVILGQGSSTRKIYPRDI